MGEDKFFWKRRYPESGMATGTYLNQNCIPTNMEKRKEGGYRYHKRFLSLDSRQLPEEAPYFYVIAAPLRVINWPPYLTTVSR